MPKRRRPHASPRRVGRLERVFGQVLREIRTQQGFTQETLAFESDRDVGYIGQIERGQKSPSLNTIMSLAGALKTSGSELLNRVETRQKR